MNVLSGAVVEASGGRAAALWAVSGASHVGRGPQMGPQVQNASRAHRGVGGVPQAGHRLTLFPSILPDAGYIGWAQGDPAERGP